MGEKSHTFIGRLKTAEQIIEISFVEVVRFWQNMSWLENLLFFDLDFVSIEEVANQKEDFERWIRQFKYDIREYISVARID